MRKIQGFSIAEAMVTMLIISIIMACSAPLVSKRHAANLSRSVPKNAIILYRITTTNPTCPAGYVAQTVTVSGTAKTVAIPVTTYINTGTTIIDGSENIATSDVPKYLLCTRL